MEELSALFTKKRRRIIGRTALLYLIRYTYGAKAI